jgi:hypothetical protein
VATPTESIESRLDRMFQVTLPLSVAHRMEARVGALGLGYGARKNSQARLAPRHLRPARSLALAIAALVVVGSFSVVGALRYFGEWGPVDHPATVAEVDAEIDAAMAANPLPAGYTYPVGAIRAFAEDGRARARLVGAREVAAHAMCAWTDFWLIGYRAGNKDRMGSALPVIEGFPRSLVADPRFADDSIRSEMDDVVAGVRAGDPKPLETLYEVAGCQALLKR